MGVAFGAEWRRLRTYLTPLTGTERSNVIALGYSAYDGEETVTSAYTELTEAAREAGIEDVHRGFGPR